MLLHAWRIALRNLLRHRVFAFINLSGLGVGVACCLLLMLYVGYELTYDRFHPDGDRIYRMALERIYPDHQTMYAVIPQSIGEATQAELPEVDQVCRIMPAFGTTIFQYEDQYFEEDRHLFADSNFFNMFGIKLLEGQEEQVLKAQNSIVLTERAARKYFGDSDPIGKRLEANFGSFQVTGVCENAPEQSHMAFSMLISINSLGFIRNNQNYLSFSTLTYLKLKEGTDPVQAEAKFPQVVEAYAAGQIQRNLGVSFEEYQAAGNGYHYFLQPLMDIHLDSHLEGEIQANGNRTYVYLFLSIALFILLIACINFMNLATARSAERAKEVGMRKVLGSQRSSLILQFLLESIFLAGLSMILALGIIRFGLPFFNEASGKSLTMEPFASPYAVLALLGFTIIIGLLAGSYPALVLSRFRPIMVLKGAFRSTRTGQRLRNGLVVFQFAISITLIAATMIVAQQMAYTRTKDLGFDQSQVMVVDRTNVLGDKAPAFREELLRSTTISQAGFTGAMPGGYFYGMMFQQSGDAEVHTIRGMVMDENFMSTMGMAMLAGRGFDKAFNDSLSIILNQAAVTEFGLEDPIGKRIEHNNNGNPTMYTVIGVVEDFHFQSLHSEIAGLAITHVSNLGQNANPNLLALRVQPGETREAISHLEAQWAEFAQGQPLFHTFFDESWAQLYASEKASGSLFGAFAGLAIAIACIGLFGLSAYTAQQRAKEMSIRKVLGASSWQLIALLSRDSVRLILIAIVLAAPLIWYGMDRWLGQFVYHIPLQPWVMVLAGLLALLVAWLTTALQSLKIARRNPVRSLRQE